MILWNWNVLDIMGTEYAGGVEDSFVASLLHWLFAWTNMLDRSF